jgi:hypothetical protein
LVSTIDLFSEQQMMMGTLCKLDDDSKLSWRAKGGKLDFCVYSIRSHIKY